MAQSVGTVTTLSQPQRRILIALAEVGEMTNVQLCRRWYKPGSIAGIWRNVAALEREKLIGHHPRLLRQSADGPARRLYHLTAAGERAVRLVADVPVAARRAGGGGYIGQEHRHLVADLWCALHEWERDAGGVVRIVEKRHDSALKRDPLVVSVAGQEATVVPDAWFHLVAGGADRRFWVECDRGTEETEAVFRRKVGKIVAAARGPAQAQWGGAGFRALFVVTPLDPRRIEKRVARILAWMEKELRSEGLERFGALFLVAGLDPGVVSGAALMTAPYFVSPFARIPRAVMQAEDSR